MAGVAGIEPAMTESKSVALTIGRHPIVSLQMIRSTQLRIKQVKYGVGNRIRTDDLQCHKLAL